MQQHSWNCKALCYTKKENKTKQKTCCIIHVYAILEKAKTIVKQKSVVARIGGEWSVLSTKGNNTTLRLMEISYIMITIENT